MVQALHILTYGFWAMLIGIAGIVTLAAWQLKIERRRMHRAASLFICVACGVLLGEASLHKADQARKARFQQFLPHGIPRLGPSPDAICANCGLEYAYAASQRTFVTFESFTAG